AFAPVDALPLFAIGIVGLSWAAQTAPARRGAFALGWSWGFGHFPGGLFWVAHSVLIDPAPFGSLVPPVIAGLAAYVAVYPGLAVALAQWRGAPPLARVLCFAVAWTFAEWLRGHLMTGFPWNLAAYVWDVSTPMMQSASLWGSWGLSLLTLLLAGL